MAETVSIREEIHLVDYRRVGITTVLGAVLGVLCIIGVGSRLAGGIEANIIFLIGMWYNRVIMGIMIGLGNGIEIIKSDSEKNYGNAIIRGLLFGVLVSSAIFLSSEFRDLPGLFAGFAYGVIIDVVAEVLQK